ncbi:50S ribosomal protein L9 [Spiroplasma culicicola]|uniref:Large ribosomal subunit protein bL9 n=1 Tax=Spiroplasma culicicola AES-1 TaxID=1276246 RepID=W6A5Z7_9MOLU|nr:50S ribosomal protein L9 [Spiroplasma culicicola]AHI52366.1 50S ribosomal protein L9 [Spiroplasma culicicola AES-1]
MKVILLQDVKNYGKKDQIVEVSDGYAKNYLIPKKLATIASQNQVSHLNVKLKNEKIETENKKHEVEKLKEQIEVLNLNFALTIKDNKPFGSVSLVQICDRLKKEHNIIIDKRKFEKHDNLNQIGLFYLKIKLDFKIVATLKVNVEGKK